MITGNEPIYPGEFFNENKDERGRIIGREIKYGITKREHFAAMAMQGALAGWPNYVPNIHEIVPLAVEMADALIAELNKPTSND